MVSGTRMPPPRAPLQPRPGFPGRRLSAFGGRYFPYDRRAVSPEIDGSPNAVNPRTVGDRLDRSLPLGNAAALVLLTGRAGTGISRFHFLL